MAKATFAAGCFWGVESAFRDLPGVTNATVGYIGGTVDHPTYQQVCTGRTGHAEAVEVEFDPDRIAFGQLLDAFFELHDPTQVNRQGPDIGTQYRTAVFTHDEAQAEAARATIRRLDASGRFRRPIATAVVPAPTFWPAEEYHQQYEAKRGRHCRI